MINMVNGGFNFSIRKIAIAYIKSQLEVCGAAITTAFLISGGTVPTIFQPFNLNKKIKNLVIISIN